MGFQIRKKFGPLVINHIMIIAAANAISIAGSLFETTSLIGEHPGPASSKGLQYVLSGPFPE